MLFDRLAAWPRYQLLNRWLHAGFEFLERANWAELADGQIPIHGEYVFAVISTDEGRGEAQAKLEYHRRYVDIQYVIAGEERFGWRSRAECNTALMHFDDTRDIGFLTELPVLWVNVPVGHFIVFFPEDAHAPLAGTGRARKAIVKVLVEAWENSADQA